MIFWSLKLSAFLLKSNVKALQILSPEHIYCTAARRGAGSGACVLTPAIDTS